MLNNGNLSDKTELAVTLRRAAAKIVVKIKKGEDVPLIIHREPIEQVIICETCLTAQPLFQTRMRMIM